MPHLPQDTSKVLKALEKISDEKSRSQKSRSLQLTRYAEPEKREDQRTDFFTKAFKTGVATPEDHAPLVRWMNFLTRELGIPEEKLVFGKLRSRLALHLSGGVMENAGILLDRFGYPYIPGSGVKGIARHAGLFALREWTQSNTKPQGADNPIAELCKDYSDAAALAADLLRVFGWVEQDWNQGNDIRWALSENPDLLTHVSDRLSQLPGLGDPATLRKTTRKGEITFLEARPVHNPKGVCYCYRKDGSDLELDVLTSHHQKYYAGEMKVALDIEEPIPVVFPTVAAGIVFVFAVKSRAGVPPTLETLAKNCLVTGITTFGAGAKTAAGYGWFVLFSGSAQASTVATSAPQPLGDYDETRFQKSVIEPLMTPGKIDQLKEQIPKLQKPENAEWLQKLKSHLASPKSKDAFKRVKGKSGFPPEWLPER